MTNDEQLYVEVGKFQGDVRLTPPAFPGFQMRAEQVIQDEQLALIENL